MKRSLDDVLNMLRGKGVEITPELIAEVKQVMRIPDEPDPMLEGEDVDQQVGYESRSNPREAFGGQRNPRALFGNAVNRTNRTEGHEQEVRRKASPSTVARSGRNVAQANREAQDPMQEFLLDQGVINSQGKAQPSLQERMKNQVGDKISRRSIPTRPITQGSGRSVAQANREAQDPMQEFLLDQGVINSQGKAQPSLQKRMRNQTPEFQREKDRANNRVVQTIPTKTLGAVEESPVLDITKARSKSQPKQEESSYWDDFVNFFSSDDDGMLSDKEKRRKRKVKSGQIAGGKGR
jgi:hypothetical protein